MNAQELGGALCSIGTSIMNYSQCVREHTSEEPSPSAIVEHLVAYVHQLRDLLTRVDQWEKNPASRI